MASKLQERLAQKTAGIDRPADTMRERPSEGAPTTMPGQLGAFRIEAQRYQETIEKLEERVRHAESQSARPRKIRLDLIDDSPYQPRIQYDPIEIDNLAHTMAAAGQKEPITVRHKPDGRYEIDGSGHRRCRAARNLGWADIDAHVVEHDDREAQLSTMVANEARVDLSDYERGKLYRESIEAGFAKTQSDVANLFGTTQANVSRRMAMLKLPAIYLDMLDAKPDLFGYNCAESITQLLKQYPDEVALIEAGVRRITEEGADQKSVKQWVEQMVKQKHAIAPPKQHAVITDRSGRAMFTAKCTGRELTIRIKASELDAKEVEEIILAALRQRAEKAAE